MSDVELIKEFKHYQRVRLSSGPYFGQRYETMNEDLLKQFIKTRSETSTNLMDFFRTMGRFDTGEITNIHVGIVTLTVDISGCFRPSPI